MEVRVNFFGIFRLLVPSPQISLYLPDGSSLLDLINLLSQQYGEKFKKMILKEGGQFPRLQPEVILSINQVIWNWTSDLTRPLEAEKVNVLFIPPFYGGEKW